MKPPRNRAAALLVALLAGAVAIGGCSADNESGPIFGGDFGDSGGGVAAPDAPQGEAPPPAAGEAGDGQTRVSVQERSIIYTGEITVEVDDVARSADQAVSIATGLGGLVAGDRRTIDDSRSHAQIILRVPADRFDTAMDRLGELGVEKSRSANTEDVTETLIDLDARLATQRASVDRVRALLAEANTIAEIVSIESELTRREAELASLEQRRERLSGLVALSTITANLYGPDADPPAEPETGFVAGLKNGWRAFLQSVEVLLTVAGWLLPWAIAIGVPIWLLVWLVNRRRPKAPAASPTPPAPPAAPPTAPPPSA